MLVAQQKHHRVLGDQWQHCSLHRKKKQTHKMIKVTTSLQAYHSACKEGRIYTASPTHRSSHYLREKDKTRY